MSNKLSRTYFKPKKFKSQFRKKIVVRPRSYVFHKFSSGKSYQDDVRFFGFRDFLHDNLGQFKKNNQLTTGLFGGLQMQPKKNER